VNQGIQEQKKRREKNSSAFLHVSRMKFMLSKKIVTFIYLDLFTTAATNAAPTATTPLTIAKPITPSIHNIEQS
jgi:hypothetical protein